MPLINYVRGLSAADHQQLNRIEAKLDAVLKLEMQIQKDNKAMAHTLDDLLAETERQTTIEASTESFISGLQAQINAAGGNQQKIDAVFAALKANNDKAAAALTANITPAPAPDQPAV